jgi:hypothetical protein
MNLLCVVLLCLGLAASEDDARAKDACKEPNVLERHAERENPTETKQKKS